MKIRISVHLNSKAEHKAMETEALTAVGAELLRAGRIPIGKEIPHTQKKKKKYVEHIKAGSGSTF